MTDVKLINGDCYEAIRSVPDNSIDLIVTDPPYQFCAGGKGHSQIAENKYKQKNEVYSLDTDNTKTNIVTGGGCFGIKKRDYYSEFNQTEISPQRQAYLDYIKEHGRNAESERLRVIANEIDNKTNTRFVSKGIDNSILDEMCRVMKKINIYIWCNKAQLLQYLKYFDEKKCAVDLLSWHKTNPIPTCNNTYLSDTEYLVFAREKGVRLYGNYATKKKYYVSKCNVEDKKKWKHPTIKPLDIIENLIINSSLENETIFDPFMGSGTTGVACKKLNRNFIGIELNKEYYDIAERRINEWKI